MRRNLSALAITTSLGLASLAYADNSKTNLTNLEFYPALTTAYPAFADLITAVEAKTSLIDTLDHFDAYEQMQQGVLAPASNSDNSRFTFEYELRPVTHKRVYEEYLEPNNLQVKLAAFTDEVAAQAPGQNITIVINKYKSITPSSTYQDVYEVSKKYGVAFHVVTGRASTFEAPGYRSVSSKVSRIDRSFQESISYPTTNADGSPDLESASLVTYMQQSMKKIAACRNKLSGYLYGKYVEMRVQRKLQHYYASHEKQS